VGPAVSSVHAGPARPLAPGQCSWRWHWEDVDLACTDGVIPGGEYCADHLVEAHAPQIVRFTASQLDSVIVQFGATQVDGVPEIER
jgi:hypothetical protein